MDTITLPIGRFHPCRHPVQFVVFEEPPRRVRQTVDLPCAICLQHNEVVVPEPTPLEELTRVPRDAPAFWRPVLRRFVKMHRPDLGPLEQLAVTCGMPAVYWLEA